jgi:hypothetical protein
MEPCVHAFWFTCSPVCVADGAVVVHKFPGFAFATPAGPLPRICVCHSSGTTEQDAAADTIIRAQKALATTS